MENRRVCVITTAHGPFDDRIYHKECLSLAKAGFNVTLIAPHDKNERVNGINIIALPKAKNRVHRMVGLSLNALYLAFREKADVYHLHDPELLILGIVLKLLKWKKIIYDVHEDYGTKILSKEWMRKEVRTILSKTTIVIETIAANMFDYILAADSNIQSKFNVKKSAVIGNYPPLSFKSDTMADKPKHTSGPLKVIYIGGISKDRGSHIMLQAMKYLIDDNIELHLLGEFRDEMDPQEMENAKVIYHGLVPWQEVSKYLLDADIGLLLLQPTPSYVNCTGEGVIKLFEYMIMQIPVVVSDFPLLKELITKIGCGICVDPTDPEKIASALRYLHDNPELRNEMGKKGKQAVMNKYNWDNEGKKLVGIYKRVMSSDKHVYLENKIVS